MKYSIRLCLLLYFHSTKPLILYFLYITCNSTFNMYVFLLFCIVVHSLQWIFTKWVANQSSTLPGRQPNPTVAQVSEWSSSMPSQYDSVKSRSPYAKLQCNATTYSTGCWKEEAVIQNKTRSEYTSTAACSGNFRCTIKVYTIHVFTFTFTATTPTTIYYTLFCIHCFSKWKLLSKQLVYYSKTLWWTCT